MSTRLGAGRYVEPATMPTATTTTVHQLPTHDGASVSGVLRTVPGATVVVSIMHPRQDTTHHALVPELLSRGVAVWTQGSRSPNNDLTLVHEQALLDVAAGQVFLRQHSFESVLTLGHSGGGTLFAFYHQQAGLVPSRRLDSTPSGKPVPLAVADMPVPDGAIFLAPHPGQGALLQSVIDPSVADESDPLSVDPQLDPFDPRNGFADAPETSSYTDEFVERYRQAQRDRIARIDAVALAAAEETAAARRRSKASGSRMDRVASLAPRLITVYRTDADLRCVDLSLDPNERPYGSLFGRRPDLTNYGLTGFGRLSTADAWLSTWSANTTRADFLTCAPGVTAPTLFIELTGDQACFPSMARQMTAALGATDLTHDRARGTHFGGAIADGEPTGAVLAADLIGPWIRARFDR